METVIFLDFKGMQFPNYFTLIKTHLEGEAYSNNAISVFISSIEICIYHPIFQPLFAAFSLCSF
tara:strand:- start:101 stop:292 length:192 start_codon:yes stop_codon:yes gene_type:complete